MNGRRRFRPGTPDRLEPRELLSSAHIAPVPVRTLNMSGRQSDTASTAIALVDQAFSSFTTDYLQAQGAFLAAAKTGNDQRIFQSYIRQRIDLLASELTRALSRVPGSLETLSISARNQTGNRLVLQAFLRTHISGNNPRSLMRNLASRQAIVPASQATDPATVTLLTYKAVTSIETARINTVNGVTFLVNKTFHN